VHGFSRQPDAWAPPGFVAQAVDVGDPVAVRSAVAAITAGGATIDLLINNAGAAAMNALLLTPPEVAADLMRVNYLGTFHCLQTVGKAMVRARRGRIINVTTVAVPLALEGEAAYVASKAAVEALTRVAARELAPQGLVIAAVGLGPVDTRLTKAVGAAPLARLNQRIGRPAGTTIAEAVDFLLGHALDPHLTNGSIHYLGALPPA
jgi:3-oxoacyl-[acyl-carrier protein] reductase